MRCAAHQLQELCPPPVAATSVRNRAPVWPRWCGSVVSWGPMATAQRSAQATSLVQKRPKSDARGLARHSRPLALQHRKGRTIHEWLVNRAFSRCGHKRNRSRPRASRVVAAPPWDSVAAAIVPRCSQFRQDEPRQSSCSWCWRIVAAAPGQRRLAINCDWEREGRLTLADRDRNVFLHRWHRRRRHDQRPVLRRPQ